MRAVMVSGVLACAVLVIATHEGRSQSQTDTAAPAAAEGDGPNFDLRGTSKAMGEMASRLKDEIAEKVKKLQDLESDVKKNQQSGGLVQKDLGEVILILNGTADELAPDSLYRVILEKEAIGIRGVASQAEADLDRGIRQKAPYYQQKATEVDAAKRDAEEMRTRLITQVDLLETIRQRVQFAGAAARLDEPMKNAENYLDGIQAVATRAERLASELYSREGSITGPSPAHTTEPSPAVSSAPSTTSMVSPARALLRRASPQIPGAIPSAASSTPEPSTASSR